MIKQQRVLALDAFRGITIAAMIMVNQPGSWSFKYDQMRHASWNGCTLTDFIFPFFLIIIGVSMWFAFQKFEQQLSKTLVKKIIKRTFLIFIIGLILNIVKQLIKTNELDFSTLRITGVFQRIAICYGIGAFICSLLTPKKILITSIGILLGYWFVIWFFSGENPYIAENTIVGKIDTFLLGKTHLRTGYPVDASGLFGSIPAIVHILWGYLLGRMIYKNNNRNELVLNMFLIGIPAILLAQIWNYVLPINKILWTSSYVVYTSGWAFVVLAFLIWIIDIKQQKKWTTPFLAFGVNPLFAYIFAEIFASIVSNLIKVNNQGHLISLKSWLFTEVFAPLMGNLNGSLLYSIVIMIFYWLILFVLHKNKIYFKI